DSALAQPNPAAMKAIGAANDGGEGENTGIVALRNDGSLWNFPLNSGGPLARPPLRITGCGWVAVARGGDRGCEDGLHTLALKADGSIWAWGRNWTGKLGIRSDVLAT